MLRLETSRNKLLIVNTILAVLACTMGFGSFVSGIFGMNLDQTTTIQPYGGTIQAYEHSFVIVVAGIVVLMTVLFFSILYALRCRGLIPKHIHLPAKKKLHMN